MSTSRLTVVAWLVVLAVAGLLRLSLLDLNGMWGDEAYSVKMALMPLGELISATSCNGTCGDQPPLYFILLRAWIVMFGSSDFSVRALSVFLDLVALWAVYDLARTVSRIRAVAWVVLVLHVLSPFAILYAQEARMYSLLLLLSALSGSFLLKLLERRSIGVVVVYLLATVGALYTHPFGVFLVIAENVFVLWWWFAKQRIGGLRTIVQWLSLQASVGVLFAPWAALIVQQLLVAGAGKRADGWWIPRPPLKALLGPFWVFLGESFVLLGVVGVLLALAIWREFRRVERRHVLVLLWACVLTPIILSFIESYVGPPSFVARYMMPGFPFFLVLVGWALWEIEIKWLRAVLMCTVAVLSIRATVSTNYSNSFKAPTPFREISLELSREAMLHTAVVLSDEHLLAWSVERYAVQVAPLGHPILKPLSLSPGLEIGPEIERLVVIGKIADSLPVEMVVADGRVFRSSASVAYRSLIVGRYSIVRP